MEALADVTSHMFHALAQHVAGALGMLESEAHQARGAVAQLRVVEQELQALQQALQEEGKARAAAEQERDKAKDQAAAVNAQVGVIRSSTAREIAAV